MATFPERGRDGSVGLAIALSTVVLLLSFVGVLAILAGEQAGVSERVPWYLVGGAVGFVCSIVVLERESHAGSTVLAVALTAGATAFVLVLLIAEGLRFAIRSPDVVLRGRLLLYLLAAALVLTGGGYWLLEHWEEVVRARR